MFTRNWQKAIGCATMSGTQNYVGLSGTTYNMDPNYATSAIGVAFNRDAAQFASMYYMRQSTNIEGGVILGTGDTPPTIDDYKLSGDVVAGYNYTVAIKKYSDENGSTVEGLYTINNTTEDDFTIREIGLIANLLGGGKEDKFKALLERTVLDNPITIPAGGVGQITYTIRMNYPAA